MNFATDVLWVAFGPRIDLGNAGVRYMIAAPAAQVGGQVVGHQMFASPAALLAACPQRVLILGKDFDGSLTALAVAARQQGRHVIAGFGDWHFDKPFNRVMAQTASACVVQTGAMRDEFVHHFQVEPHLIEEPYEGRRGAVKVQPGDPLQVVWYGHASNLSGLSVFLHQVLPQPVRFRLLVVCNQPDAVVAALQALPPPVAQVQINVQEWSEAVQAKALEWSDVVIIPNDPSPKNVVKGHNRLVGALQAGRFALAAPLPQYRELAEYCSCSDDYLAGLAWAATHADEAAARVKAGQAYIDTRFAPAVVGAKWRRLISAVAAG